MADRATNGPYVAVDLERAGATRAIMQAVDVLRDECKIRVLRLERGKRTMAGVGFGLRDEGAAPVVPFPDQFRIARETLRRREVFGSMATPQPARAAKGRDTAFSGDARAGQHRDRIRLRENFTAELAEMVHENLAEEEGFEPPSELPR